MSWRSRPEAWSCLAVLLTAFAGRARAQGWRETSFAAVGAASRPAVGAAGVGIAWRDPGRTRVGVLLLAGADERGGLAGRMEAAWHFLLDPAKRTGDGVYGGAGVALAASGGRTRPFILLVLGAENAPAGRRGTFVEIGVGGGVRLAVGMRWRKQNAPSR